MPPPARDAGALTGRIREGRELFESLEDFLEGEAASCRISLWGTVSEAVVAVLDPVQGVYATTRVEGAWELASCTGFRTLRQDARPGLALWAVLAQAGGRVAAGRLFPGTRAVSVAFSARELPGPDLADPWLWPPA
ncbi:MAG: DNA-binding protein [Proteobacteria bacterium]|nr:DNA-binding protein [Pseudomonadota bacterium]